MALEERLLKRIKNGDATGLEELVLLYYEDVFRYCLWHTHDKQAAEDATQDTFLKAISHISSYEHRGKLKAYLFKIASNVCVDYHRRNKPVQLMNDLPDIEDQSAVAQLEEADERMELSTILIVLPEELREIVLLRFVHDLKLREISQIVGLPLRTVQSRLRSALKQIEKGWRRDR